MQRGWSRICSKSSNTIEFSAVIPCREPAIKIHLIIYQHEIVQGEQSVMGWLNYGGLQDWNRLKMALWIVFICFDKLHQVRNVLSWNINSDIEARVFFFGWDYFDWTSISVSSFLFLLVYISFTLCLSLCPFQLSTCPACDLGESSKPRNRRQAVKLIGSWPKHDRTIQLMSPQFTKANTIHHFLLFLYSFSFSHFNPNLTSMTTSTGRNLYRHVLTLVLFLEKSVQLSWLLLFHIFFLCLIIWQHLCVSGTKTWGDKLASRSGICGTI